jgi:hypothetical protein
MILPSDANLLGILYLEEGMIFLEYFYPSPHSELGKNKSK